MVRWRQHGLLLRDRMLGRHGGECRRGRVLLISMRLVQRRCERCRMRVVRRNVTHRRRVHVMEVLRRMSVVLGGNAHHRRTLVVHVRGVVLGRRVHVCGGWLPRRLRCPHHLQRCEMLLRRKRLSRIHQVPGRCVLRHPRARNGLRRLLLVLLVLREHGSREQ